MIILKCDRCQKEINKNDICHSINVVNDLNGDCSCNHGHLCKRCFDDFKDFMSDYWTCPMFEEDE